MLQVGGECQVDCFSSDGMENMLEQALLKAGGNRHRKEQAMAVLCSGRLSAVTFKYL